jgi:sugar O-acyltransferase (sialic acid O-acetyltransferase NeuD family)
MILYIYCAGGFGKEVKDIASRLIVAGADWESVFFVDDTFREPERYGSPVTSFDRLRSSGALSSGEFVIANGEPRVRESLYSRLEAVGARFASVVDLSSLISPTAKLARGVIVAPFCSISSSALLSENSSVNTMTIIGHDVTIGRHAVVSSMVNLGGGCVVGDSSYVGMGALVKEGLQIGTNTIIGMGSVVYDNIPDGVIALGNPARVVRKNVDKTVFRKD